VKIKTIIFIIAIFLVGFWKGQEIIEWFAKLFWNLVG